MAHARRCSERAARAKSGLRPRNRPKPTPPTLDSLLFSSLRAQASAPSMAQRRHPTADLVPAALGRRARRGRGNRRRRLQNYRTREPDADQIAIVLRDPARRGPLLARVMESYGIGVALEAELPVAVTGVGGSLSPCLRSSSGAPARVICCACCAVLGGWAAAGRLARARIRRGECRSGAAGTGRSGGGRRGSCPYDLRKLAGASGSGGASPRRSGRPRASRRRWQPRLAGGREDGPRPGLATGSSWRPPRRSRLRSPSLPSWVGRRPTPRELIGDAARASELPRLERPGRGTGADRPAPIGCGRGASTTSSSARCRTASSRAATRR